jgi:glycosyltransferase involved in cell wall biosynthesis
MTNKFLMIAGYPSSILNFRGAFLRSLIAEGFEVHVAVPDLSANSKLRERIELLGIQTHQFHLKRVGTNPFSDLRTFCQLCFLTRKIRPDFVLSYTVKPVIYGSIAAWLSGVPRRFALITGLGYSFMWDDDKRTWLGRIVTALYSLSLRCVEKVFFQNPDDEELFNKLSIIKSVENKSVVVNGSGVDVGVFNVVDFPEDPQFLMIARLLVDKGVREYVKAASIVRSVYPNVRFGLAGWLDSNPNAITRNELNSWLGAGVVEYFGFLEDVRPVIAQSSVYVLPSYREGTPRTVLEAMSMGRPIITTEAPGCRETVLDGYNGFLVPVRSIEALASAMLKFLEQPELIAEMGKRSREIAEAKYDVNAVNEKMFIEMNIK